MKCKSCVFEECRCENNNLKIYLRNDNYQRVMRVHNFEMFINEKSNLGVNQKKIDVTEKNDYKEERKKN